MFWHCVVLMAAQLCEYTKNHWVKNCCFGDFPGHDSALPLQGAGARSLVHKPRSHMLRGATTTSKNKNKWN